MENQIYMFFNKLANRYEGVFSFATDALCVFRLSSDQSFDREQYEVVKVGSYDLLTGIITPTAPVRMDIPVKLEKLPVQEARS